MWRRQRAACYRIQGKLYYIKRNSKSRLGINRIMTDNERKELETTIEVLKRNVRELEKQLHDAYKRISELQ